MSKKYLLFVNIDVAYFAGTVTQSYRALPGVMEMLNQLSPKEFEFELALYGTNLHQKKKLTDELLGIFQQYLFIYTEAGAEKKPMHPEGFVCQTPDFISCLNSPHPYVFTGQGVPNVFSIHSSDFLPNIKGQPHAELFKSYARIFVVAPDTGLMTNLRSLPQKNLVWLSTTKKFNDAYRNTVLPPLASENFELQQRLSGYDFSGPINDTSPGPQSSPSSSISSSPSPSPQPREQSPLLGSNAGATRKPASSSCSCCFTAWCCCR
jgi:hypothetical protein